MPERTAQTPTKVVRKNYFRSDFFFLGLFFDLMVGGIGLFFMVQLVGFGVVFYGIPLRDWEVYFLLGVQNVPLILAAIQVIDVAIAAVAYGLFWRHLLRQVEKRQSASMGASTIILASTGSFWLGLLAFVMYFMQWWMIVTGAFSKLWATFGLLPLVVAVTIGGLLGRTVMVRHWTRGRRLVVETASGRWMMVKSRRLLAIQSNNQFD
jgi:hypothetical protein